MRDDNPIYENIILSDHRLFYLQKYVLPDYAGEVIPSHFHFMPEIMWFRQAGGSFTINGDCYPLKDNTLVYIPPLIPHELQLDAAALHYRYLLQLEDDLLTGLAVTGYPQKQSIPLLMVVPEPLAGRLETLFAWCDGYQQFPAQQVLFRKALSLLLEEIFLLTPQRHDGWQSERPGFMHDLLQVLQQMERENRFELGTLEAAQRCGVSKSYFSRRFKAHFGMTFKEYLLVRKLKSAVGLLLAGERKIADIAEATGFTDSAYFTLKFRTLMGCTPTEFRLQAAGDRGGKAVYPHHAPVTANDFFISANE